MADEERPKTDSRDRQGRFLWHPADQRSIAILLALLFAAFTIALGVQWWQHGRLVEIEQAEPLAIDFRVDINRADWPELTLLPGIGESYARGIVASRETDGPFTSHEDLLRVRGIGPKRLEMIRPYLLPVDPAANSSPPTADKMP